MFRLSLRPERRLRETEAIAGRGTKLRASGVLHGHDKHGASTAMTHVRGTPDPARHYPLRELPALVVSAHSVDVRGWTVVTPAAERVGVVMDLLVEIETLRAEYLLVDPDRETLTGFAPSEVGVVPLQTVRFDRHDRQVVISNVPGFAPEIRVQYRSTTRLVWAAAAIAAAAVLLAWALGLFGR